jgi:fibronectin type 3 domain-containing protein
VRSFAQYPTQTLESADSNLAILTPRDTFAPAAPQGLVAVLVPAQADVPAHIELSWAISPETDLAGYNVYRSERAGAPGTRLNTELLLTPAFRDMDMNVQPGRVYFYTVTALDSSGNESPASVAVSGGVPAESQSKP